MKKVCELGRSMVEMLGVLAIIGVLSVGGIAGYSKAMMKYKLNQHMQQISELFYIVVSKVSENFFTKSVENTDTAELLNKLNLLPEGMQYKGYHTIKTTLDLQTRIYHLDTINLSFHFDKNETSLNACMLTLEMIKKYMIINSQVISMVYMCSPCHYYAHAYRPIDNRFLPKMTSEDFRNECIFYSNKDDWYIVLNIPIK